MMKEYPGEIKSILKRTLIDFAPSQFGLYAALKNLWIYKNKNRDRNAENKN